ncbi:ATP-binding cassette domain-containing protein [soil metagenome]
MNHALVLDRVAKHYAGHTAVDDLSLVVPRGLIYGILGPNGAGKSTTIRMVMNIIARDSGHVSLLGVDPERDRTVLRRVGYLPEERGLYKKMRVIDVIVFFARLKGVPRAEARRGADEWLERMGLAEWRASKVDTLSKGMQQKVQFIATVLHSPELLILDEPFSGLDPVNQEVLQDTVLEARAEGRTVIFSTHNMPQAEQLCDQVCIIAEGRKVLDGDIRRIRREAAGRTYRIEWEEPSPATDRLMGDSRWFTRVERRGDGWEADLAPAADPRDLLAAVNTVDVPLIGFVRVEPSLHDIFVERVGRASVAHRRPEREVTHV